MFLASFALFTRAFTSFLRFKRGILFFIGIFFLSLLILLLITKTQKKEKSFFFAKLKRIILTQTSAFLITSLVISLTLRKQDQNLISNFFSFAPLRIETPQSAFIPFMEEVLVLEQTKPNTYIVQTNNGKTYFLKTETPHHIGKSLHLGATLKTIDPSKLYTELLFSGGGENFRDYQFNYDKRLLMKGISGTLYEKFSLPAQQNKIQASWLHHQLSTTRTRLKERIQKVFPDKEAALLLGMLIGDKSQLETGAYQNFVNSGIVHIIAVSGGNLVMIVVFLSAVLFRIPFYIRNGLIILGVIAFALLCGGDSSVIRALIMTVLSLFALFRGREIKIWRLLKYAFVLMLCYNPFFLIYDLGFLLSFGAVIGIVLINEWRTKFQKIPPSKPKVKEKKI
jgi:ComEC/Rec2-like protein